ncbi:hypothetical protein A5804_002512 [Enterococcus faecium]|uniref:Lipoprotein n=1 Tax=Enterococcus faecium TaxID=1352 RepID=A0AB73NL63_ENTFC|nr:hypothetical protein [Enterococcus faecium]OTO00992.1 hypothetical protein A5804_002512 [Enterococcus faecium]
MKKIILLISVLGMGINLGACSGRESDKVSYNVSQEADNFNVIRRVAVINTRTDKVEFEAIGRISVDTEDKNKLVILVETGKNQYKKHLVNMTSWNMYVIASLFLLTKS